MTLSARRPARFIARDDATETFAADVIAGLSARPKTLLPKYFYDSLGSQLFEQITLLPEYYPTRTELRILRENARVLATMMPKDAALIEFGAGSASKAKILLNAAPQIGAYVPVDISAEFLADEARRLERDVPRVGVFPVAADFTAPFELPPAVRSRPRVGFFPGSTIGNFEPVQATAFLRQAAAILGPQATFIVGADRVKDEAVLLAAYNDAAGVTAKFNLNLLSRINRELGGTFDLGAFVHEARYDRERARIEMHLMSTKKQVVRVREFAFAFDAGETIHTESSHKFTVASFTALATAAGWTVSQVFSDAQDYFSVYVLGQS
ncbi:MAG TPA: L-histidine N(alpha)-methyltransferase [Xanthobacteraceae bacterium]|nr:L-histidine N(alpha)-methyltransferase [Xanthobacteraceae bacterium]